jgi:hypothetical protein
MERVRETLKNKREWETQMGNKKRWREKREKERE